MQVDIYKVREAVKWLDEINRCHFSDIEWSKNGEELTVADELSEHFEGTGLKNTHFATLKLNAQKKDS